MAKVHKGWLKTREGDYFSPNTLSESLYSREGTKYDDVVKGYVQKAKIELETIQMLLSQKVDDLDDKLKNFDGMSLSQKVDDLYDRLKNFDGNDSDTLYIVDGNGYKLAQFDKDGITTTFIKATDFTAGNGFALSGAMFYNLQGSIDAFPDGI